MKRSAKSVGKIEFGGRRVVLDHDKLDGTNFSDCQIAQFSAVGSSLHACRFENATIENASFGAGRETTEYVDCSFDGARIAFGPGGFARFVRCSFREVELADWFCFAVELVECSFGGLLRRAFFNGTVPEDKRADAGRERNEFRGNDFSSMDLVDVGFRTGIDLTKQQLPSDAKHLLVADAVAAVGRARANVVTWKDPKLRQAAMADIVWLEDLVAGGQRQLFLERTVLIDEVAALLTLGA